jgi:DNA-directed RNA polymerase subunit RPC12/RpoP
MSRKQENTGFICMHCGERVVPLNNGSYRNHCPLCLHSKHVDVVPGDRQSTCGGRMAPVGLRYRAGKGLQIVHVCLRCGQRSVNRVAGYTAQPDAGDALAELSALPQR